MPAADTILEIAGTHVGEKYILGARAPMGNPNWSGPWDCAEFASWCVFQATGILYGTRPRDNPTLADAYTGYWAEQAEADDACIGIEEAARIPGAMLLRKAGSGLVGHIVISDGTGGTVEAHSSRTGVIRGKVSGRRWDAGILVPGVKYFANEDPVALEQPERVLRVTEPLMRGERVRKVQEALVKLGYLPGTPDGIYGPQTAHAVRNFQNDKGLVADGEAGPATLKALKIA